MAASSTTNTLFIVCIEPIETRYTCHWYKYLPDQIRQNTKYRVVQIDGQTLNNDATPGAFLNFSSTIYYKDMQNAKIAKLFSENRIKDGDVFLFTDAWNPTCHNVRYMADLNNVSIQICGIWHAGQYDPTDFLGRKMKDPKWAKSLEESMYLCYDKNIFATEFHYNLFHANRNEYEYKSHVVGFPMEYYDKLGIKFTPEKENIVLFPHRISEEKNIDLFRYLSIQLPQYQFVVAQEVCKTKEEYHDLLMKSKLVFSANKQETLGIAMYEALLAGCNIMVPDDLSYSEMYYDEFKYDPFAFYNKDINYYEQVIIEKMEAPLPIKEIERNLNFLKEKYFNGKELYKLL